MSEVPFHVAGGTFTAKSTTHDQFSDFGRFLPSTLGPAVDVMVAGPAADALVTALPEKTKGSRRRKLWEISHKFHCPVIGSCFEVAELRALMNKVMHFPAETSDFVLHTTAVGACETRSRLAELLHKQLEKRFTLTIRQFAGAKSSQQLGELWQQAVRQGSRIPAALWAAWTHPACDPVLEQLIYGDIHMIQHQIGTGTRADLRAMQTLRQENHHLLDQLEKLRRENEALRREKASETAALGQRIVDLRAALAGREAGLATTAGQLAQLRDALPDLKDRQSLLRRASDAEGRNAALTAHAASQQDEIERLRRQLAHAGETINQLVAQDVAPADRPDTGPTASLSGKCVLCVGGRSGAVDAYRQAVEQCGGRFLHHDGGLEESLHRIDGVLAAADFVICQAGCISHNAYWRVKEQCKRTGKQCLFVKGAGVSSFGRMVSELGNDLDKPGLAENVANCESS